MDKLTMNRCILAVGAAGLVLVVTGCAAPGYSSSAATRGGSVNSRDMGQMNTQQGPQGETGTSHTMGGPAATPRATVSPPAAASGLKPSDMGQMSTHGTPQGETGTPH